MTNEEREALIAQGWTPPKVVDPDLAETYQFLGWGDEQGAILAALKHGREIERAEAKPGMVWVKHEQSNTSPVPGSMVTVMFHKGHYEAGPSFMFDWWRVDYYAIITPPEDK